MPLCFSFRIYLFLPNFLLFRWCSHFVACISMVNSSSESNKGWKAHRKTTSSLWSPFLSRILWSFKMIKGEFRWKQISEVNDRKASPGNFILLEDRCPWRGGDRYCYLEPTGVGFELPSPIFRIGSMLSLVLGYGKLPSQVISFLPLQWLFFLTLLLLLQVSCLRRVRATSFMWQCFPRLLTDGGNCTWEAYHRRSLVTMRI